MFRNNQNKEEKKRAKKYIEESINAIIKSKDKFELDRIRDDDDYSSQLEALQFRVEDTAEGELKIRDQAKKLLKKNTDDKKKKIQEIYQALDKNTILTVNRKLEDLKEIHNYSIDLEQEIERRERQAKIKQQIKAILKSKTKLKLNREREEEYFCTTLEALQFRVENTAKGELKIRDKAKELLKRNIDKQNKKIQEINQAKLDEDVNRKLEDLMEIHNYSYRT